MGQQVRSVSKSDLRKKKSIHEASQLPVFAPLLHKCSGGASPQSQTVSLQCHINTRLSAAISPLLSFSFVIFLVIKQPWLSRGVGELLFKVSRSADDDFCSQLRASVYG